jgi:hypothetical protein
MEIRGIMSLPDTYPVLIRPSRPEHRNAWPRSISVPIIRPAVPRTEPQALVPFSLLALAIEEERVRNRLAATGVRFGPEAQRPAKRRKYRRLLMTGVILGTFVAIVGWSLAALVVKIEDTGWSSIPGAA